MALIQMRPFADTLLELPGAGEGLLRTNHVLEPEFHQAVYVDACKSAESAKGAFQLQDQGFVVRTPYRGVQPKYADDEDDANSLSYEGLVTQSGEVEGDDDGRANVCALKSNCVRWGFVDFGSARSVTREFYQRVHKRAAVKKHDVLINSTGDGTIGRVAVYDRNHPAVVDGHITIVRFKKPEVAWYAAAYLLSPEGQNQIYRYINGSSGQVEIYPQDIGRLWIAPKSAEAMSAIAKRFQAAVKKHHEFYTEMRSTLSSI